MRDTGEEPSDERAISNVVGVALLIGIAVVGAVVVVVFGGQAVQDVENENRMEVAEQSVQEVASRLNRLNSGEENAAQFSLPDDLEGEVRMSRETTFNFTSNVHASTGTCTTGDVTIGTILYDNQNGQTVGYEAGGVFRTYANGGTTVVSPPELSYRNGRLDLSLSDFAGNMGSGQTVVGEVNQTSSQNSTAFIQAALLSNRTVADFRNGNTDNIGYVCANPGLTNVTVNITGSRYADAWHRFAHRNYDEDRVTVRPGEDATIEAGDTVSIQFMVGDTTDPEFVVEDREDNESVPSDEDVRVNATIRNTGGLPGTQDITLQLYDDPADPDPSDEVGSTITIPDVSLEGSNEPGNNNSVNVSFRIPSDVSPPHLESDSGIDNNNEYLYSVGTDDDVANETFEVGDAGAEPPHFQVTNVDAPDSIELSDEENLTATIENTHPSGNPTMSGTQLVTFSFDDGDAVYTREVQLDSGESEDIEFEIPTYKEGANIPLNITTEDNYDDSQTIDIGDTPYFRIDDTDGPWNPTAGDSITFETTVENTGDITGDFSANPVEVEVYDDTNSTTSVGCTLDGSRTDNSDTVAGGSTETLECTVTAPTSPGSYTYQFITDDERSGQIPFFVGNDPNPNYQVDSVSIEPDPVYNNVSESGDTIEVNANVTNVGATAGAQDISFDINDGNETDTSSDVNIAPGDSWQRTIPITYNVDGLNQGQYDVVVETENTTLETSFNVINYTDAGENEDDDDGNVTGCEDEDCTEIIVEGVFARLQVIGTEYTFYDAAIVPWNDDEEERYPTEMDLVIENESGRFTRPILGPNTDVNRPMYQDDQKSRSDMFNVTVPVPPGEETSVSVFAESFDCDPGGWFESDGWVETDVISDGAVQYRCDDRDGQELGISSEENTGNLLILENGDTVPSIDAANQGQRSTNDMLGPLVDENTGELNLDDGQLVLLYELSEARAEPEQTDWRNGVDYNDAVVLFEVIRETEEVSTGDPGDGGDNESEDGGSPFVAIADTHAPNQVDEGESAEFAVNVTNFGDGRWDQNTDVELYVEGVEAETETITNQFDPGQSRWANFTIPTGPGTIYDTTPPDSYNLTARLVNDTQNRAQQNVYIGEPPERPYYVPNVDSSPDRLEPGDPFYVDMTVTNVGNASEDADGQDLTSSVVDTTGNAGIAGSVDNEADILLDPGNSQTETLSGALDGTGTGTVTLEFATENETTQTDIIVGQPNFSVACVEFGAECIEGQTTAVSPGITALRGVIHNQGELEGDRDVQLEIYEGSETGSPDYVQTPVSASNPITLSHGESTDIEFDFPLNDPGTYVYNMTISDGGTDTAYARGEIQIVDNSDAASTTNSTSSDLISIDMNMITIDASG